MSNAKKIARPDIGPLGLCLQCLGEVILTPEDAERPRPKVAVTLAPMLWPPGEPVAVVAVPACMAHVAAQAEAVTRKPLLLASGGLR